MDARRTGVLLSTLMLLFVAAYSGYAAFRYFYSPYQTETAYQYTVSDSYEGTALFLRDEVLLYDAAGGAGGLLSYTRPDGAVVTPGCTIALVYADEQDLRRESQAQQLENEIALLTEAQTVSRRFAAAEGYRTQVYGSVGGVTQAVLRQNLGDVAALRVQVQTALGKHRIASGKDQSYESRILSLREQRRQATAAISQSVHTVTAAQGGYFCSTVDGYETQLSTDFSALGVEQVRQLTTRTAAEAPSVAGAVGKVQQGHDWYLALAVTADDAARFTQGTSVELWLPALDTVLPASIHRVLTEQSGEALIIFRTNYVSGALLATRRAEVQVRFESYTGLRISLDALRYEGQLEGVYVKNGNLISFRPIERIYTADRFVLCTAAVPSDEIAEGEKQYQSLGLFDEVVVRGTELYDGKII